MTYTYYKVLDKNNNVVLEGITDDAYSQQVLYDKELWSLGSLLYSYFPDEEPDFTVNTIKFTTDELNHWLMQRTNDRVKNLNSEGYILHPKPNNE